MFDERLLDSVTEEISGILWFTTQNLNEKPNPFETIDYIIGGLLTKHIKQNHSIQNDKNLFFAQAFFRDFFVGNIKIEEKHFPSIVREVITLIKRHQLTRAKILVIDSSENNSFKKLQELYPELELVNYV